MLNQVTLSSTDTTLPILIWNEQPVITFAMIDEAHKREAGTASRNFRKNRKHFIEGEDYFHLTHKELNQLDEFRRVKKSSYGMIILTLAGYTMLTKSLTDDLAWTVQRELVNSYFKPYQPAPQKAELTLEDILKIGNSLEKTLVEITHTEKGEIVDIEKLEQRKILNNKHSTVINTPSWQFIVETFFNEIASGGIPEKMRQNMLISKVSISLAKGEKEQHDCLFFRISNLMEFFRQTPRFYDLLNASGITRSKTLWNELNKAGVLAFNGKTKEKGIPIKADTPLKTRRVPHLVALDLVVLEKNYGIIMTSNKGIAKTLK